MCSSRFGAQRVLLASYLGDVVGAECATLEIFFFSALSVHRSVRIILAVLRLSEMEVSPLCSDEDQRGSVFYC